MARGDVPLPRPDDAGGRRSDRRAWLYVEMLESGFTAVGEFHYLHNEPRRPPYAEPRRAGRRIVAAAATAGIGLTLLPVFYAHATFGGVPPNAASAGSSPISTASRGCSSDCGRRSQAMPDGRVGVAPHSLRAVTPDELAELVAAGARPRRSTCTSPSRSRRSTTAWRGRARGRCEWLLDNAPVDRAGASSTPPT